MINSKIANAFMQDVLGLDFQHILYILFGFIIAVLLLKAFMKVVNNIRS